MSFLGFPSTTPTLGDFGSSVGDIVDSVFGDVIDTLKGNDKFKQLFDQKESDFKQFPEEVTDRRKWTTLPADRTSAEYAFLLKYEGKIYQVPFNINPQREIVTEPHSSTTQYTQGGGKLISSEGMITKDITIQGTCGLYPGQGTRRKPDSGIGSGLEAFKFLQNVFRRYCFLRRYGDLSKGLQLIYINRRRQEAWVVEPKSFTSEDAVEHNFYFTYTIVLECLYPYEGRETKSLMENLFDSLPGWRQLDAVIQRVSEAVDTVNAAVGQISAIVDGFGNTVMTRVMALSNTLADVSAGRLTNLKNFKRDSVKQTVQSLRESAAALEAAGQHDLAHKVVMLERAITGTLVQDQLFEDSSKSKSDTVTKFQRAQISQYRAADGSAVDASDAKGAGAPSGRPAAAAVLGGNASAPAALAGSETKQAQDAAKSASEVQTISSVGGSALDSNGRFQVARFSSSVSAGDAVPPSTRSIESQYQWESTWSQSLRNIDPGNVDYRSSRVNVGDSIQTVAFRLLGDHARWPELVLLNDLRYPYVASPEFVKSRGLTNVIPYGGEVLFPVQKTSGSKKARVWRNETFESLALSPLERNLGNDVLIDENSGDVVWTANDLALTYGVDNLRQFIRKRVQTRKSTLRRSPNFGFSNYIGISTGVSEAIVRSETRALFSGDERIRTAEAVSVRQEAQALLIAIAITVKDQQEPLMVTTKL